LRRFGKIEKQRKLGYLAACWIAAGDLALATADTPKAMDFFSRAAKSKAENGVATI
jgi:hypothetical protein